MSKQRRNWALWTVAIASFITGVSLPAAVMPLSVWLAQTGTSTPSSSDANAPDIVRIEAESMDLSGYDVESRTAASGGALIRTYDRGTATAIFPGVDGEYDIQLAYFDEHDGESRVTLIISNQRYTLEFGQNLGAENFPTDDNRVVRTVAAGVYLTAGSVIEIQGTRDIEEYARIDTIEFVPLGMENMERLSSESVPSERITSDPSPTSDSPTSDSPTSGPSASNPRPLDGNSVESSHPTHSARNFQVIGTKIYDPRGREFIVKGTNAPGYRYVWPGDTKADLPDIDRWGFNLIRLNCYLGNKSSDTIHYDINDLDDIITEATQRGIVVMPDAHDKIGGYWEGADLEELKAFWREQAQVYKNNPYVWFNIANEPGGMDSSANIDRWVTMHQAVIEVIRDEVGADNLIVVDGHYWGQDLGEWDDSGVNPEKSAIISRGHELKQFNGKTYENIVFSVHFYDQWRFGAAKMNDYFDRVEQAGHSIIVGEYGVENGDRDTSEAMRDMFEVVVPREIGRVVWSWWGGDDNDLTTGGNGGGPYYDGSNLTELGRYVWNDNRRTENLETLPSLDSE